VAEIEQSLSFLSTKIQNVPLRHRSLQVTFDHSWRLLPTDLQQVLAKVSVFRGTFERDAAEYVAGASDLSLAGLVDHSMLHAEGGRFQMNEPLRQFGEEKLAAEEKGVVRLVFAKYYASFLEEREKLRWTEEEPAALDQIGLDLKNILAGWQWLNSQQENAALADECLQLIGRYTPMITYFYLQYNRFHEGVLLFEGAFKRISAAVVDGERTAELSRVQAKMRMAEAVMRFHLSQFSRVNDLLEGSLVTFRELGDQKNLAMALVWLGKSYNRLGTFEKANTILEESLSLFRGIGARVAGAEALNGLGIVATSQERFEVAEAFLHESLAIYEDTGYLRGTARALSNLGTAVGRSGKFEPALPLYEAALKAARSINDVMAIAVVLSNLGGTACVLGDYEASLAYYEESLAIFQEMGEQRWLAVDLNGLGETYLEMGQIDSAVSNLRQSLEISTMIQSVPDTLDSLAALGDISVQTGQAAFAVRLLTFVVQHRAAKPHARARAEKALEKLTSETTPEILETSAIDMAQDTLARITEEILNRTS
jgi:tetratricopeptide (TPR) repeat protein